MRGVGDGHRGWDLQQSSTMTNGTVEQSAASSDGQILTLKYKDGEKKIVVSSDTPIVVYAPGENSELKPGASIFISAAIKQPDGTLKTPRVNVGRGVARRCDAGDAAARRQRAAGWLTAERRRGGRR